MTGYFSASHKALYGSCWWSTPDGRVVEITEASSSGTPTAPAPDLVEVGEVTEWHHGRMYCKGSWGLE